MSVEAPTISTNQVVDGKYQIVRQLGQGGMGAVYEAIHLGTSRRVALKVVLSQALLNEPEVVTRFHREAKASGSIDSQHVVQVLDTGVDPSSGNPYMVMEYLAGEDLITLVRRVGPLAPDVVVRIGAQACLGLQRAHDASIIHRDIKSANMFLSRRDGGEVHVKLLDFGIAKVRAVQVPGGAESDHGLTTTGAMMGSPLYMSPEQVRGMKTLDGRADVWSLGVALYEALAGETPNHHAANLGDLLIAICVEPTPPLQAKAPWVPSELARVIERTMEKDPARRFQSPAELHAALVALAPHGTTLREEMLVPLTPELRAYVAPPAPAISTGPGAPATPGAVTPFAPPNSSNVPLASGVTNPELGQSTGAPAKRASGAWPAILALSLVVGAVAVGGVLKARGGRLRRAHDESQPAPTGLVETIASVSTAPTASASASATAPAPIAEKTVAVLVVAPPDAKVFVDDAPAAVKNGSVSVSGKPGSSHKIRSEHPKGNEEAAVVITDEGTAVPSTVMLVAKKNPTFAKPAASAGAQTAVPAVAPKPAAAKPAEPSEPGLKPTF